MAEFPHSYAVSASGGPEGVLPTRSPGIEPLETTPPPEFGGPEGYWSPETMLTGAVANCFILTFRAISRKAGLEWKALDVDVDGTLDRTPEGLRFTQFELTANLEIAAGQDIEKAESLLEKAEKHCLVTASLNAVTRLQCNVSETA